MPTYYVEIAWPQTNGEVGDYFTATGTAGEVVPINIKKTMTGKYVIKCTLDYAGTSTHSEQEFDGPEWSLRIPSANRIEGLPRYNCTLTADLYVGTTFQKSDSEQNITVTATGPTSKIVLPNEE